MKTEALRALLAAATPGPWTVEPGQRKTAVFMPSLAKPIECLNQGNAALIVALRNNAEALLDENERLRNSLRAIADGHGHDPDDPQQPWPERVFARAVLARLEEQP